MKNLFHILSNYKRACRLLYADDARKQLSIRYEKEAAKRMFECTRRLTAQDIKYIKTMSELDIKTHSINLATTYRELSRIKHFLSTVVPNTFEYIWGCHYPYILNTIYVPESENKSHSYSLDTIETVLAKTPHGTQWPTPHKLLEDPTISFLYNSVWDDFKKLKELIKLINSYS